MKLKTTRMSLLRSSMLMMVIASMALGGIVAAQGDDGAAAPSVSSCLVTASPSAASVLNGPSPDDYGIIGVLPYGESLPVVGRNDAGDWYAVAFVDERGESAPEAWVDGALVEPGDGCQTVPVLDNPGLPAEVDYLMNLPVLPTLDRKALRSVFLRGQRLGNDPHVFTKVGDCNTDTSFFLTAFDEGPYELGPYQDLQPSVDFFAGSFEHVSLAGQVGFNAMTMLDPLWVHPDVCRASDGEGPLTCEYRREDPSVVVIMFGPNDLLNLTHDQFRQAVTDIITISLEQGVIPVLTTFTWHHDHLWQKALEFNVIQVEVANQYSVPVINFWRAAQDLPNLGLIEDYTHLTDSGYGYKPYRIVFQGEETTSGYALRNLLTLQVLDMLRREVLGEAPTAPLP